MLNRLVNLRLIVVLAIALAAIGAFACGAADEPDDAKAAATSQPAAAAATSIPSAPAPEPAAAVAPDEPDAAVEPDAATEPDEPEAVEETAAAVEAPERTEPGRAVPMEGETDGYGRTAAAFGGDWYVPRKQVPGETKSWTYTGPRPLTWQENPRLAQMVQDGELLSLEERWVVPDDRLLLEVDDEIGVYGGTWRMGLGGWTLNYDQWAPNFCSEHDTDYVTEMPWLCKDVQVNDAGNVWTMTMREGMRWWHPISTDTVTGVPATMEHVIFAWEDLNFDFKKGDSAPWRARFPGIYRMGAQAQYNDPVTGEMPDFTSINDVDWTLTWTSPHWNFIRVAYNTRGTACGHQFCFIAPKFYMTKYHPQYGDHDEIEAAMEEGGFAQWNELLANYNNVWTTNVATVPWLGEIALISGGPNGEPDATLVANPMFWASDPVGNQLPLFDGVHVVRYESQEVATFRAMAGEMDGNSTGFVVGELPMYQAGMEKGDYSIYGWMNLGSDGMWGTNQTYNEDPEIGKWIRTREFRQALSFALDRDALNQVSNLGLGTIHSASPNPTSPYYPGDAWANKWTTYDPDEANRRLDALGLVDTDGDGFRNRTGILGGGTGNLSFFGGTSTDLRRADRSDNPALILQENWAAVGLEVDFRADALWYAAVRSNQEYLSLSTGVGGFPFDLFPNWCGHHLAQAIGCWVVSRGLAGGIEVEFPPMIPGEADATYLPIAPSDTWAADPDGEWMRMWDAHSEGIRYADTDPRRLAEAKTIFEIMIDNQWSLSTVAFVPRKIFLKRNNFRNVSRHSFSRFSGYNSSGYYFEDGKDNENNPDNRSVRYKSESFLTGLTY